MLLGREHEISVLRRMLDSAPRSVAKSALIEGGPGTGKTSLLRMAAELAHGRGFHLISARGRPREQRCPFAVARHLAETMLSGPSGGSRAAFLPACCDTPSELCGCEEPADMRAVLPALYSLTKEISASHHLVITIDDLQWVDGASLQCLDHLLARLENVSVNIIATYTPGHLGAHASLLADLTSQFGQRLMLQELDDGSATAMLADLLDHAPDEEFTRACLGATRGNPLFLAALSREVQRRRTSQGPSGVAEIAEIGPAELAETLFTRYFGEASQTLSALETIAVLGEPASPDLLAEITGLSKAELDTVLRRAIDLGLVRSDRETYSYVHPVLRRAVVNRLSPTSRQRLHLRSARVLHEAGAPKERVAKELLRADPAEKHDWAAMVLYQSALEAAAENRTDNARDYLLVALGICPDDTRGPILRLLGRIEVYSDPSAAAGHLRLALECSWPEETLVEINTELASAVYLADGAAAAADALSYGLQKITSTNGRAGIRSDLQVFKVMAGTASARGEDESDDATGEQATDRKRAMLSSLRELWSGKSRARALRYAEYTVKDSAFAGHPMEHVIAMVTMIYGDEFAAAQAHCDQLMAQAREQDSAAMSTTATLLQALVNYRIGDLIQAHHDATSVLEGLPGDAAEGHGHGTTRRFAASKLVATLLEMGNTEEAHRQLDRYWPASGCSEGLDNVVLRLERGRLQVANGALKEGLHDLEECGRLAIAIGQENPAVCPWRSELALAHVAMGNVEQAILLAEQELERARVWGAPRALGIALRTAGLAYRDQHGLALLAESHEVLSGSNAVLEIARTHLHLGIALRKRNRLAEARKHLREARILTEKCGARPLSRLAGQELVAAGARPRRVAQIGPDALTPSERRVAMLAAQGHTNREIAEQLHVLQRTVEIHLSRTYHKLGISGRRRLAAAISPEIAKGPPSSKVVKS